MVDALQHAAGPAGRLTRGSIPDDGPSSTLLGHAPPAAGATIQVAAGAAASVREPLVAKGPRAPIPLEPAHTALGTLRSEHQKGGDRPVVAPHIVTRQKRRRSKASLWLWAAAGVALGVVSLLVAAAVSRLGETEPRRARSVKEGPSEPDPIPALTVVPPPQATATPTVADAPVPAPSEPEGESRNEPVPEPAEAPSKRPTPARVAPKSRPADPAPKPEQRVAPSPARGTPDMGF
jgi:hypothetical protein